METLTYTAKVRKDGSLSLSKQAREALGIEQGDEIEINIVTPVEKTNGVRRRIDLRPDSAEREMRIVAYFQERVERDEIALETVQAAQEELTKIERELSFLASPNISTSINKQVLFTWDKAEHHLLLEIFPDRSAELFSRNRLTNTLWEHDYQVGDSLPQEIVARIRQAFEEC